MFGVIWPSVININVQPPGYATTDYSMRCMGCHHVSCSGACLATHRAQYVCHNVQCVHHLPCPLPVEVDSDGEDPEQPEPEPEPQQVQQQQQQQIAIEPATTEVDNEPEEAEDLDGGENAASSDGALSASGDDNDDNNNNHEGFGNLIYRETITREYRLVNGQIVHTLQSRLHPVTTTTTTTTAGLMIGGNTSRQGVTISNNIPLDELLREIQLHEQRLGDLERGRQPALSLSGQSTSRASNTTRKVSPQPSAGSPVHSPEPSQGSNKSGGSQKSGGGQSHGGCNGTCRSSSPHASNASN